MANLFKDNTAFLNSNDALVLIKADSPYFTIVEFNKSFRIACRTEGTDITGKSMTELHSWNDANEESALTIHDALNQAISSKEVVKLPAVRYDLPREVGTGTEPCWWQASYEPILSADGKVEYLLCAIRNITEEMM